MSQAASSILSYVAQGIKALSVKRLDLAFYLDRHRIALAVTRLAGRDLDPAFADAIFLDIGAFLVIELDANIVLEDSRIVVRAARIDRETVRKWGELCHVVHGRELSTILLPNTIFQHSPALLPCFSIFCHRVAAGGLRNPAFLISQSNGMSTEISDYDQQS
jgi:hypothetical protein